MLIVNLALFAASCIVLIISGSWLVKSLTKIAKFLRLSEFTVAFIIMAVATSMPELFVGISSALAHNSALALGNVIGANILNLTLVIGIAVVLARGIKIESKKTKIDSLYMCAIVILPLVLMLIGRSISRLDGIILIAVFLFYSHRILKRRKRFKKEMEDRIKRWDILLTTFLFVLSFVILYISAKFLVQYATLLSIELLLPPILIGLFLLSIGTTLPELVFETRAVLTGHSQMTLGNSIGSVVANSTLVLGVTAIIYPITATFLLFFTSAIFMIIVAFLFATFVESGSRLYWKEGLSLIFLYIFFIIIEFYIKGIM